MLGAIAGDVIGSPYEHHPRKSKDFRLFSSHCTVTDDSVLTAAIAEAILESRSYKDCVREWGRRYPRAGYGGKFRAWLREDDGQPYQSWGNGSAMRVSPVGWAFSGPHEVLAEAAGSAAITHDHPEGIKAAEATALAVFLARTGHSKADLRAELESRFGYDLSRRLDDLRPGYSFDVSSQGSVPEALIAFLESESFEDAIRNAVSLGGDSDTQAAIAGAVAEAHYGGVPQAIQEQLQAFLPDDLRAVVARFRQVYRLP